MRCCQDCDGKLLDLDRPTYWEKGIYRYCVDCQVIFIFYEKRDKYPYAGYHINSLTYTSKEYIKEKINNGYTSEW
jgi:hypothetical protein